MGASSVTGISGPGAVRGMAGPGNNRNFWVSQVSPHILAAGQGLISSASGATVTFVATSGVITSVTATPAAGGTTYPASQTFNLWVGGTGTGGIVAATTNGSGVVTSFALVAGGSGYDSGGTGTVTGAATIIPSVTLPTPLDLAVSNYTVMVTPLVAAAGVSAVTLLPSASGTLAAFTVAGPSVATTFSWAVSSVGYGVEAAASPNAATGWPDDREAIVNAQTSATLLPYG